MFKRNLTRLEALKIKLRQLEEEPYIYSSSDCPLCEGSCQFLMRNGSCLQWCTIYMRTELNTFSQPHLHGLLNPWMYELERRFWISHCLREIKTEILKMQVGDGNNG